MKINVSGLDLNHNKTSELMIGGKCFSILVLFSNFSMSIQASTFEINLYRDEDKIYSSRTSGRVFKYSPFSHVPFHWYPCFPLSDEIVVIVVPCEHPHRDHCNLRQSQSHLSHHVNGLQSVWRAFLYKYCAFLVRWFRSYFQKEWKQRHNMEQEKVFALKLIDVTVFSDISVHPSWFITVRIRR